MKLSFRPFFCAILVAGAAAFSGAQTSDTLTVTSATKEFSPGFPGELEKEVAEFRGDMGIYYAKLDGSESIKINENVPFETASTIKTAVMVAAFDLLDSGKGPFKSYYDTRTYTTSSTAGGSGLLQNYKENTKVELKELIHLMMTVSDNVATNMLSEWMGLDAINDWLIKHDFEQTRIFSTIGGKLVWSPEGRAEWGLGRTTPAEMGRLMTMIAEGKAGSAAATDEMLRVLSHQYFDATIPGGVPPTTWVGSKTGSVNRSRSDCAIVRGADGLYVLVIFTKNNVDTSWNYDNEAQTAIRRISNKIWNHLHPQNQYTAPAGVEKF